MKTFIASAMLVALMSAACNMVADNKTGFRTHAQYKESFSSSPWCITSFVHDSTELKDRYSDYYFKFPPSHRMIVSDNMGKYTGSWSVGGIDGNDDRLPVDNSFIISIKSPPVFSNLNGSWTIDERTESKLTLSGHNKETNSTDVLVFEKR